jgi:GNAT superfamily N-acetyltransferase
VSDIAISSLSDFEFSKLSSEFDLSTFHCGDENYASDIAGFLKDDAANYCDEHMANTYVFHIGKDVHAYFCLSNDCLNDQGYENTIWNRFHRKQGIPNGKRIRQYPSIKIGRLGVHTKYHRSGIAYELMDFIKGFAVFELKPACRLLLLDAVNQPRQIKYYERNGFKFLLDSDANNDKRLMFFDLRKLE